MHRDQEQIVRQLGELGERAKAEGGLIAVEELLEIIGIADGSETDDTADDRTGKPAAATFSEAPKVDQQALTVGSGQLREVIKALHDRGRSEIALVDLLDRLRVGPLQRPASEYVDFAVTEEGVSDHILSMLEGTPRPTIGQTPLFKNWVSYSPLLDRALVRRGWARTFCRLGVHLFDQYYSLERGARLYCDACSWEVALRDPLRSRPAEEKR